MRDAHGGQLGGLVGAARALGQVAQLVGGQELALGVG